MKNTVYIVLIMIVSSQFISAQVTLDANDAGNTYEDINAVLAPGYNAVESPDCNHNAFGRHIEEVFDSELNINVFKFSIHTSPDNDRCQNFDRQRNEIKTYDQSPDNLKAIQGETVEYKWKFKLSANFQPSSSFTHIHQIKSVGGSYASIPMITLTLRKATQDRLELRYTSTNNQTTIQTANLDDLRGHWVTVTELITYAELGSYAIEIKKVSDNQTILSYANNAIDTWQDGADFARPKWGIYRSLNNSQDLQDENVLFANFSIEEIQTTLSVDYLNNNADLLILVPNPSNEFVEFKNLKIEDFDYIQLYDSSGQQIKIKNRLNKLKLNVSDLDTGMYYINIVSNKKSIKVLKCIIK